MRLFIAPDKFKGTLSAAEAARAISAGLLRAGAQLNSTADLRSRLTLLPMADGGEGSLAALHQLRSELRVATQRLADACGHPRPVSSLHQGGEHVFESARLLSLAFAGNRTLPLVQRDSHGLGEWCRNSIARGARTLRVFVGGTAVCDGGLGALRALGFRLRSAQSAELSTLMELGAAAGGGVAVHLEAPVESKQPSEHLKVEVLVDVTIPLCGPNGAAQLFAPQKGALAEEIPVLEAGLGRLSELLQDQGLAPNPLPAGIGAGGGIGLALLTLAPGRAEVRSGAAFFLEQSGLSSNLSPGDIVLTGEGRTDAGTLQGKLVHAVHELCNSRGAECVITSGSLGDEAALRDAGYAAIFVDEGSQYPSSSREAAARLTATAERAALTHPALIRYLS